MTHVCYRSAGAASQVSTFDKHFRTQEEQFFPIVDLYLARNGLVSRMDSVLKTEYAFHRCEDETIRAVNFVIQGDVTNACFT